jgi:hypothetical protein
MPAWILSATSRMGSVGFDAEGKGTVRPIKRVLLPDSIAAFWDKALSVFFLRPHLDSKNNALSYRKQPFTGIKRLAIILDPVALVAKGAAMSVDLRPSRQNCCRGYCTGLNLLYYETFWHSRR